MIFIFMDNTSHLNNLLDNPKLNSERIQSAIKDAQDQIELLSSQGKYGDSAFADANRSVTELQTVYEKINRSHKIIQQLKESAELLQDPDMKDIAIEEIENLENETAELIVYFEAYILEPLPNDANYAIVEIRPGVGGAEASLFAEELMRSYIRYCNKNKFPIEQTSLMYDDAGGIKESIFVINTKNSFGTMRFEAGVHRVQRVPVTESGGRIHTSTASVVVLPVIEAKDVQINDNDLRIDVFRSSGPGGQSVNTTDSAVRVTHLPTGISITSQNTRSQQKNKEMAMTVLMSKLYEIEASKKSSEEKNMRMSAIMGGDRSVKIRTYNFAQSRITDHRIGKSWFNLAEALNDDMSTIIEDVNREMRNQINEQKA